MSVTPIGAIGGEATKAVEQLSKAASNGADFKMAQATPSESASLGNSIPASLEIPSQVSNGGTQPGFVNSVLDSVYTEIDKLGSKVPKAAGESSPIDTYKNDMASQVETLNPQAEGGLKPEKDDAVSALSKTFDHAIFMAMVNQVVSGVSDTSRTLIKQS